MKTKEAISVAISVLDVRADQWAAAADGLADSAVDELYESDDDHCHAMESMCREAIKALQETRND